MEATPPKILKCPSCGDRITALTRTCPSCDFVMEKKSSASEGNELENLISKIEDVLVDLKSNPAKSFLQSIGSNLYISGFLFLFLGLVSKSDLPESVIPKVLVLAGIIMILVYGPKQIISLVRNRNRSGGNNIDNQKALLKKYTRQAETLFGANRKVRNLLQEFENEMSALIASSKKAKMIEYSWYGLLLLLIVVFIAI